MPPLMVCCQQLVQSRARSPERENQQRIFRTLLAMDVDVEEKAANSNETPLVVLQKRKGFAEETRLLLGAGADPNRLVGTGNGIYGELSALHVAAYHGLVENVEALLEAGATVDLADGDGRHGTALDVARARGKKKVVELLKRAGSPEP